MSDENSLILRLEALRAIAECSQVIMGPEDKLASCVQAIRSVPQAGDSRDSAEAAIEGYYAFRRQLQVEIGILLKLDNVSFLLGGGCSLGAGGVTFGSIPYRIERELLSDGISDQGSIQPWLQLFYNSMCAIAQTEVASGSEPRKAFLETLSGNALDISEREAQLKDQAISDDESACREADAIHSCLFPLNFEHVLSALYGWSSVLQSGAMGVELPHSTSIDAHVLDDLLHRLKRALVHACSLPQGDARTEAHKVFFRRIMTRPENLRRVKLFTLNYDTLLEQAADAAGVILLDGFVGAIKRVFHPESFEYDFYFPGSTTEGRVHRLDRVAHLYKLHGSLTWYRESPSPENPFGIFASSADEDEADVLVFPTPVKQELATGIPYSEMFRRFAHAVTQSQSVLFVIGYGFGDDHVNAIIRQALLVPSFRLVIVSPRAQSAFVQKLVELGDPRVWLLTGWPERDPSTGELLGFGTFEGFVQNVLPDLADETIRMKIVRTHENLAPNHHKGSVDD